MPRAKTTPKQQAFIECYLISLNATQAAIEAGYSQKSAANVGSDNLRKPHIKAALALAMAQRAQKTGTTAEWVLETLRAVWESDLADIIHPESGTLRPISEWPPIWRKMVSSIDVEELQEFNGEEMVKIGEVKKVKILQGKTQILKMIGDHTDVAAFATNVKVTGTVELVDKIKQAQERAVVRRAALMDKIHSN